MYKKTTISLYKNGAASLILSAIKNRRKSLFVEDAIVHYAKHLMENEEQNKYFNDDVSAALANGLSYPELIRTLKAGIEEPKKQKAKKKSGEKATEKSGELGFDVRRGGVDSEEIDYL